MVLMMLLPLQLHCCCWVMACLEAVATKSRMLLLLLHRAVVVVVVYYVDGKVTWLLSLLVLLIVAVLPFGKVLPFRETLCKSVSLSVLREMKEGRTTQ